MPRALIRHLRQRLDETVTLRGWLASVPRFSASEGSRQDADGGERGAQVTTEARLRVRDGSGSVEAVIGRELVSEDAWDDLSRVTPESTVRLTGVARAQDDADGGVELKVTDFAIDRLAEPWPEGVEVPIHLTLRSETRWAVLRLRSEVSHALREFFHRNELIQVDLPSAENLSFQPFLRAACAALGRVYSLGPGRGGDGLSGAKQGHWTAAIELAFVEMDGLLAAARDMLRHVTQQVAERCGPELAALGREPVVLPTSIPQRTFEEARAAIGLPSVSESDEPVRDLTPAQLARVAAEDGLPFFLTQPPIALREVDIQPAPKQGTIARGFDWVTPRGWTVLRGGQRLRDIGRLKRRLAARGRDPETWQWSLDLRRYGGFPSSGFIVSIEALVAWIGGLASPNEAVAFPLDRLEREAAPTAATTEHGSPDIASSPERSGE